MIQTPQAFSYSLIFDAYDKVLKAEKNAERIPAITDDAMVAEYVTGCRIKLVQGSYENIKITTPEDIHIAELFLRKNEKIG